MGTIISLRESNVSYQKKFYILLAVFFVMVGSSFFLLYKAQKLIFLTDISTQPLNQGANPDLGASLSFHRDPVYLVSYADGPEVFFRNQAGLAQSALGRGVDIIANYRRSMISPAFLEKNKEIFNKKRGAGYWLWKPWVILDTMKKAPENAIIIYCDGGVVFKSSLKPLIDLTKEHSIILSHYEDTTVYKHASNNTKREVFIRLECDEPKCHNGPQIWAGFMILKNNPEARKFVESWLQYAQDPSLLIEGPSSQKELPEFQSHLHDQALLNVLYSRAPQGKYLLPYDAVLMKDFTVWTHRRNGVRPGDDLFIYSSLTPYYGYIKMDKIDKAFYQSSWLKKLRRRMFERN